MNERLSPDVAVTTPSRPREIGILTTVDEAITSRRSVRGFLPKPVPRAVVEHLLRVASRAPSGTNTQPWCVHVAAGDTLTAIKQDLLAAHDNPEMRAGREYEPYPMKWYEPYLGRRRKVGWDLYGLLGIARGDRQAMHRQHGLNYELFGAPVGLFFTLDRRLGMGSWLDYGMFLQNIMIAARGHGLHSCPQAALANYPEVLRRHFDIPEDDVILCGMALGYEDKTALANSLRTEREPVENFATFYGF